MGRLLIFEKDSNAVLFFEEKKKYAPVTVTGERGAKNGIRF